ncbi:uncharacterized protein LOC133873342 [Alnus glutinosa]|uniref:uncharacterized protein LOC133873342 n=1 Tax=Alnus glutinosa TaxID=3517 RepID=UPI002D771225|nr:uncharacterized protein LOC133873342 [Alnus glutinosa]
MGIIARDCMRVVKAAMCAVIPYIRDLTVAEALGARRAMKFGRDMGYEAIELEGDASEIVEAIRNSAKTANRFGGIIRETRQILESFGSWRISLVRREGNRVAHLLAKFAVANQSHYVWFNVCPSFLVNVVTADHLL